MASHYRNPGYGSDENAITAQAAQGEPYLTQTNVPLQFKFFCLVDNES